jgi:lipid-A-disaccharide synthase
MTYRIFVSAGETSGDRHAASLVRALRRQVGEVEVRGLGGEALAGEGATLLARVEDLSVVGFAEVARRLPFFVRLLAEARREIAAWRPHLVLPVDYPGFNLRLARNARRRGIPVAYYIAPQVWAWRRERRPGIARAVDRLLVVFPFEEPLFRDAGVNAVFVGHPLLDADGPAPDRDAVRTALGVPAGGALLALLPGSRRQEVERILPPLMAGSVRVAGATPAVSRAPGLPADLFAEAERRGARVWNGRAADLVRAADAALVASGTATLETGLAGTPLAVVYRTGWLNWQLARALVRLRTVGLVNIAAGGTRVPELLEDDFTPERVAETAHRLLFDRREREEQARYLAPLRERLGGGGAAERAAREVAAMLEGKRLP